MQPSDMRLDDEDEEATAQKYEAEPAPYGPIGLSVSVVAIAFGAILVCSVAAMLAMAVLVGVTGREGATEFLQDLRFDVPLKTRLGAGVVSCLYTGTALSTFLIAIRRSPRGWTALMALVRHRRTWRTIIVPSLAALAYAALATTLMARGQDRHLTIAGPTDLLLIATLIGNLVILAPVAEELLFRGWIYTALRRRIGIWPGSVLTAVLFAGIHYDANHRRFFLVLPLAIALGFVRELSGSIRPTIVLHASYNLVIVTITLAYA